MQYVLQSVAQDLETSQIVLGYPFFHQHSESKETNLVITRSYFVCRNTMAA